MLLLLLYTKKNDIGSVTRRKHEKSFKPMLDFEDLFSMVNRNNLILLICLAAESSTLQLVSKLNDMLLDEVIICDCMDTSFSCAFSIFNCLGQTLEQNHGNYLL